MPRVRVLISDSYDPYFNLAVEDSIFRSMPTNKPILFLWRNAETVVIGRGQNPWKECNTRRMEKDGITLARRQTGGGAVFHDLGNTNFTFMAGKPGFDKSISTQIVLNALDNIGIQARSTGRNDLVVDTPDGEKKFSGSAYRNAIDRGFHHGTLLLNADLTRLANYLNPDPKKLKAKGITSVRARVVNLREILSTINHRVVSNAIQDAFSSHYQESVDAELICADATPDLPGFSEIYERQMDWNWNYGKSLEFSHTLSERFAWGGIDIHLDVRQGRIEQAKIFTDSLTLDVFNVVQQRLIGGDYSPETIGDSVLDIGKEFPECAFELKELSEWLVSAIA